MSLASSSAPVPPPPRGSRPVLGTGRPAPTRAATAFVRVGAAGAVAAAVLVPLSPASADHGAARSQQADGRQAAHQKVSVAGLANGARFRGFIVRYREGTPAAQGDLGAAQATLGVHEDVQLAPATPMALGHVAVRATPPPKDAQQAERLMRSIAEHEDVEFVEPNLVLPAPVVPERTRPEPDDPKFPDQWHLQGPPEEPAGVNAPAAWAWGATGRGVVVAVVDTGSTAHPDLDAQYVQGYDFITDPVSARDGDGWDDDPSDEGDWTVEGECGPDSPAFPSTWHGTHVAGTVAAVADDGYGVAGVAPGARIQPVRVLGACGGTTADVTNGIAWAAGLRVPGAPANPNPARVINLSLGGQESCPRALDAALMGAYSRGVVSVIAAGNGSGPADQQTPANCSAPRIVVAALDREGNRAAYSNYGWPVDVAAPGGETRPTRRNGVLSTVNTGERTPESPGWAYYQGTSMATPHVAGLAALLVGQGLTPYLAKWAIQSSARVLPGTCDAEEERSACGAGLVDAGAAVDVAGSLFPGSKPHQKDHQPAAP
ncbi:serine protease [Streptoalloteichus tenebrarius]|uniref:Serine protease n=1 Tax=Streptoalloteichus tenebrarius (strain ATCC 17920 / DSM 40477 / JCM 4838 / CBS 697.72 / NBRC 16177 / NCIMB 11028 / NRRL B-12390 / A12253. 1 / ISP 5477) TaxID=1933 RepID=A0ABT1HSY7_STRSD|nr:S8 family peptidase [Streptoalloteichus tenebrarius]MCP2258606.1 serine protease [Streptoalloteichus tenebrarius]BFF04021.1 hypothetical protein GCM10020241_56960 [Streptoalloteichus tenebrarius]